MKPYEPESPMSAMRFPRISANRESGSPWLQGSQSLLLGAPGRVESRYMKRGREPCKGSARPSGSKYRRQALFRSRRKRGGDGFNYREMMIALNPATAARIGLTARSKTRPGLFDQPPQQGSSSCG